MVEHIKEGQDRFGIDRKKEQLVGAVFRRSNNPCDVDAWRLCHSLGDLLQRDGREVIYGSTESEIESEVWKRHPVDGPGVTLVTKCYNGWEIERTPRLMQADLDLLHQACAFHKRVLVDNDLVAQMGGRERLVGRGFLLQDRSSRSACLVRYNPRQVVINRWKREVEDLSQYFQPELPAELVEELFEAVRPEHWPEGHPFRGVLAAGEGVTAMERTSGDSWGPRRHWRRRFEKVNLTDAPEKILALARVARRLGKAEHKRPWRGVHLWKELLERLVPFVHGVEAKGDDDWKQLARWVRSEARAAKVKVPRKRKLPPRPVFGKRKARHRCQPQLELVCA